MTTNVRFYRLGVLPSFEVDKHKGIFVHVTGIMDKNGVNPKDPNALLMNIKSDTLVQWLTERRIDKIASGLWFGGENGWELLSNDTTSGAIDAAINAKIQGLDVGGYAQAEITTATNSSTLTIKGIQEVDGKIGIPAESENLDLDIAIDGVYSQSNKIATKSTVINAINGLDVETPIQAVTFNTSNVDGNTTLTFKGIKEVDGVIAQGNEQTPDTFIVGDAKLKIQIGSAAASDVFSANAQSDSTIQLDGNVFKKVGDVISVITKNNNVSSDNPLVTQNDINSLAGAMHYRGGVTNSAPTADNSTKKGDVWIATEAFGEYEAGDMFIARADGASATFDTVQGNLTLGTGDGQIAKNVGALADGKLVVGVNPATGSKGIKTVDFDVTNLTGTTGKNERTLKIENGTADTLVASLYHSATITDDFTVIGKPFTKSINISSTNRSIEIAANASENATGVVVDLVWNTTME